MTASTKAWVVSSKYSEASLIVWTHSRSHAKSIARRSEWFNDEEWCNLRTRREPEADNLRPNGYKVSDTPSLDDQLLMRSLGWHEVDGGGECSKCGLYEWKEIKESHLDGNGECVACRKKD
jgi:hypothetical protein